MKIESIRIRNFRLFKDETIPFNSYTAFVGPNGCGKSSVFSALNIFFQHTEGSSTPVTHLYEEDFHHKNTKEPVVITVTFTNLTTAAQADFAAYVRHGKLSVSTVATYDEATRKALVKQCGERLVIPEFSDFFSAEGDGAKVDELQKRYAAIREIYDALPEAKTKPAMLKALQEYEAAHPEQAKLLQSNDQFYGVTKGKNILEKYVQWVYVPAVKDATTEQVETKNTALGKLLARTVRQKTKFDEGVKELRTQLQEQYQGLLDAQQGALDEISLSLGKKLSLWAHPDASLKVEWKQDPDKSVKIDEPFAQIIAGEGSFKGELVRFGHGFQRTFLFGRQL